MIGLLTKIINKAKMVWPNLVYLKQGKSIKPLYRFLRPYYVFRHYYPFWRNVLNQAPKKLYERDPRILDETQNRIIAELKENGIAVTHLNELFRTEFLPQLQKYATSLIDDRQQRKKGKTYMADFWEKRTNVDLTNPFLKLTLSPRIVAIANGYLGMYSKFFTYSLNLVSPVGDAKPISSQRWHRDPEDKKLCKIFIYLNDVDEETGPFTYAKRTHADGRWNLLFRQNPPQGSIDIPEKEIERAISKENIKVTIGKAGTVIFCDTAGIHRGGYARSKQRLTFTGGFCSPASLWMPKFLYPSKEKIKEISDYSVKYALQPWYDHLK